MCCTAGVCNIATQAAVFVDRFQHETTSGKYIAIAIIVDHRVPHKRCQLWSTVVTYGKGYRFVQQAQVLDGVFILQRMCELQVGENY